VKDVYPDLEVSRWRCRSRSLDTWSHWSGPVDYWNSTGYIDTIDVTADLGDPFARLEDAFAPIGGQMDV
jgi:hypothetical protein